VLVVALVVVLVAVLAVALVVAVVLFVVLVTVLVVVLVVVLAVVLVVVVLFLLSLLSAPSKTDKKLHSSCANTSCSCFSSSRSTNESQQRNSWASGTPGRSGLSWHKLVNDCA